MKLPLSSHTLIQQSTWTALFARRTHATRIPDDGAARHDNDRARPEPGPAQHLLAARAVHGADRSPAPGSAWRPASTSSPASPVLGMVLFLAVAFGFMFAIEKTKNSAAGVAVLLGVHLLHGPDAVAPARAVLGFKNGARLIMTRVRRHGGVFFAMATLATVIKRDLSRHGQVPVRRRGGPDRGRHRHRLPADPGGMLAISVLAIGIFSAFMLYDLKRSSTAARPTTSRPRWRSTWTSSTCSRACWRCWASAASD